MRSNLLVCIFITFVLAGCQTAPVSTKSASEPQAVQSREFETTKKVVFAAALSVLQDDGYIADSADFETGLITAKSPMRSKFVPILGHGMSIVKVNAFTEEISTSRTRMRVNFANLHSVQIRGGRKEEERPIEDKKMYEDFYGKVEQSISVEKTRSNQN